MTTRRIIAVLSAGLFAAVSVVASPAYSLSKQAKNASELNELEASDEELTRAIAALDKEVASQQAVVDSAQQAVDAAAQSVAVSDKSIAESQVRVNELKGLAAERAVQEYMRPQDDLMTHILSSEGFADASRRSEFLEEVSTNEYNVMEELRAVTTELENQRKQALKAQKTAEERKAEAQKKLDELNAARAEQQRLHASLEERIKMYAGEDEAAAAMGVSGDSGRASRGGGGSGGSRVGQQLDNWPLASPKLTSPYGKRWGRLHAGVDFHASVNTPIFAAKSGTVIKAGWMSGYGNYTCIDHGDGLSTCYAHQNRMLVSAGDTVSSGDQIGLSGNTGASTGPHLHFEVRVDGEPVDPMSGYLP